MYIFLPPHTHRLTRLISQTLWAPIVEYIRNHISPAPGVLHVPAAGRSWVFLISSREIIPASFRGFSFFSSSYFEIMYTSPAEPAHKKKHDHYVKMSVNFKRKKKATFARKEKTVRYLTITFMCFSFVSLSSPGIIYLPLLLFPPP